MVHNNVSVFNNGMDKAQKVIAGVIDDKFVAMARKLYDGLCNTKFFSGFTGNTQRSFTVAYFLDGEMRYIIQGKDTWTAQEIRYKVRFRQNVFLSNPYEGYARSIKGATEVDNYYGWQTAMEYVMQHNDLQHGWQIVMGVGTEYYFHIPNNPYGTMKEQAEYIMAQEDIISQFCKQVKAAVQMQI